MEHPAQPLLDGPAPDLPVEVSRSPFAGSGPPIDSAQVLNLQRHLHAANSVPEILRRTSDAARTVAGFKRAVALTVAGGTLTPEPLGALNDPASDRLRRELLAAPVVLAGGTAEADFIRRAESGRSAPVRGESLLQRDYGFDHLALGAIIPDDRVLALIAADSDGPVEAWDHLLLQGVAHLATYAIERHVLRQRMSDFRNELRYMMVSANALVGEGIEGPIGIANDHGESQVLSLHPSGLGSVTGELDDILTRREIAVAREVAAGRSNRAIAASLHITEATAKKYVSRIMRKLGTTNRAETAVRCLRLSEPGL